MSVYLTPDELRLVRQYDPFPKPKRHNRRAWHGPVKHASPYELARANGASHELASLAQSIAQDASKHKTINIPVTVKRDTMSVTKLQSASIAYDCIVRHEKV